MEPYKTVSARATEDTKVIKLPFSAFKIAFEKYPDAYLRVVQIVMIRQVSSSAGSLLFTVLFTLPVYHHFYRNDENEFVREFVRYAVLLGPLSS
jgi:hypothetical protein